MTRLVFLLLWLAAPGLPAMPGLVRTLDGQAYEGEVRLEPGLIIVANTNAGASTNIELRQLALLTLALATKTTNQSQGARGFSVDATNLTGRSQVRVDSTNRNSAVPPATGPARTAANVPSTGLRGTYYNDTDLTGPFLARFDPTIDFDWGQNAPFLGVNEDRFSVRWTGEIVPQVPDLYTFYTVTDDGVRLWVDKKLVIDAWREGFLNLASLPIYLQPGQKYELRMETFESTGRAMAKLSWSSQSMPRTPVSPGQLVPGPPPEPVTLTAGRRRLPAGVVMRNGSHIARAVESADETVISLAGTPATTRVSTVNAARILLRQLTVDQMSRLQPGRPGVLLKNDDFVDGDFKGLADGKVRLNSVLFGMKSYELDKVAAISLRDLKPISAQYEVKTRGESLFRVDTIQFQKDAVALRDADLSGFRIPAEELVEIKKLSP